MKTIEERLLARRDITDSGCWEWVGHRTPDGYGTVAIDRVTKSVHRVSFETFVGPIPDGLVIDHLCRNRGCFNPRHLEPVTLYQNTHRSPISPAKLNALKAECKSGHEFTPENTYTWAGGKPEHRLCRTCRHEATRAYRARRSAAALEAEVSA